MIENVGFCKIMECCLSEGRMFGRDHIDIVKGAISDTIIWQHCKQKFFET